MSSFIGEHKLPGAALAVARNGRLLYARGFGYADLEKKEPVQPDSLFRIASVSKPLTSAAILQLVERKKLSLDDHAFALLEPALKAGEKSDERLAKISIRDLLAHAGGFDRDKSGDPMFMARRIARDLRVPSPPAPSDIVRWMAARPLDFDPGTKSVYSNFGYCLLGRIVERAGGESYERFVQHHVLQPLGITRMRLGRTLESDRAEGEVRYYSAEKSGRTVFDSGPQEAPNPYGSWCLESMDAHGGWIASAPDLVRFATGLGQPGKVLREESLRMLWARPAYVAPKAAAFYACGWMVRPVGKGANTWHNGSLPGTSTLLVRRHDGFVWAVLFNSREGNPAGKIDGRIHEAVDAVREWPEGEALFNTKR
jgi:N-acyl-D-amino-acid deacylase